MNPEVIPELPDIPNEILTNKEEKEALSEFENSDCKFMFYVDKEGESQFYFQQIDTELYAALVVYLEDEHAEKIYSFLKLALEAARLIKKNAKNGTALAGKIEKHFSSKKFF